VPRKPVPDPALGAVLKRLRTARGESQESVAYRSGLSSNSYARIELAQSSPAWDTVGRIIAALDVSLVELAQAITAERKKAI